MLLGRLFESAGLECPENLKNTEITKIVTDSRLACAGCMFIALKGNNTDGHKYIAQAVKNGAVVIVAEQVRDDGCVGGAAILKVDNTLRVAALLYNAQSENKIKGLKIIGVTGTNGKTSVCAALECIFLAAGVPCAVIGTTGCRINGTTCALVGGGLTTPAPDELYPFLAHAADTGVEYVFMEVSSHAIAMERIAALHFEYGVFTNLTRDHLDFHKSMEEYFLCKARLFEKSRFSVINTDDAYGARLAETHVGVHTSLCGKGDFCAADIEGGMYGSRYTLRYGKERLDISIPAIGTFSVANTLEAAAVALMEGIDRESIVRGLSCFRGAKGRMELLTGEGDAFDVIIDYAHTPDALEKALMCVRSLKRTEGRIILVFGCGGDRDRGKRREMAHIASRLADFTVITSDNPRSEKPESIISDILKGIDKEKPHVCMPSRKEAIAFALELAARGDAVLLCGKGHEKYEIDADGKHPFDEEAIVLEQLSARNEI